MTCWADQSIALLTPGEMGRADRATIAGGVPGTDLMEAAGQAVVTAILGRYRCQPVTVLCGPGNNGGDGFVIARLLEESGWPVALALSGDADRLAGDAAIAASRWPGTVVALKNFALPETGLIVDALFGAGLSRPVAGAPEKLIKKINDNPELTVISVDIPTGIDGETGQIRGEALKAELTVTFFRPKPGHYLYPGRAHAGELVIADIGIGGDVLEEIDPKATLNRPELWESGFPVRAATAHKYSAGAGIVISGGMARTGAARLAAMAMLRTGAGVVSVASPPDAIIVNAMHLTAIMVKGFRDECVLGLLLGEKRLSAIVAGPGLGLDDTAAGRLEAVLEAARAGEKALVLDADGLTLLSRQPGWAAALPSKSVLTPHDGEFIRLFPDIDPTASRLDRAREAAEACGHVVVLKGADTVIAHPDGRAAVNDNAPPELATAGSGDVLAGIIGGLLAQGMPPFEAALAGVWVHGAAARGFGPGLTAEDLPARIPPVLKNLVSAKTVQVGPV